MEESHHSTRKLAENPRFSRVRASIGEDEVCWGKMLKTLTRAVAVECYANRYARRALRGVEKAYREMLRELVEYAVKYKA